MANNILQKQTERKEKKRLFMILLLIQSLGFHKIFPENQRAYSLLS